jgi:hypothetical protein
VSARERRLSLEAAVCMVAARVAIRLVPFRWLVPVFERAPREPPVGGPARAKLREEVRQAIHRAAQRLPSDPACFPKAVAAQAMLRRRGVGTTLCYGASTSAGAGLAAHVWLVDGEDAVIGARARDGYRLLARYSPNGTETA